MSKEEMVLEFHKAMELPYFDKPSSPAYDRKLLRCNLLDEEVQELKEAIYENNKVEIADGIVDCIYILLGTAWEFGLGNLLPELFAEVHRSNMSKLHEDGRARHTPQGKVIKPPTYSKPDLEKIINGEEG